ncbi:MAG: hypothetical protein ACYC4U_05920 [Pirellulaceae bacterium]
MADDLEAFLRQAAQRRAQHANAARRPAAPAPPPPRGPLAAPPPKPQPQPHPHPKTAPPVVAEVVAPSEPTRLGTRVSTAAFEQRAEHLGEEVGLADEHMEAHLAQRFDHQVGSQPPSAPADRVAELGERLLDPETLAAMLADPTSLRQAVLLSEILARPDFD